MKTIHNPTTQANRIFEATLFKIAPGQTYSVSTYGADVSIEMVSLGGATEPIPGSPLTQAEPKFLNVAATRHGLIKITPTGDNAADGAEVGFAIAR